MQKVLHRVKEKRNIIHTIKARKGNWIGHSLRRNCLPKHVMEGKIGGKWVTERRGIRSKQPLKKRRGCYKLKEEALDRSVCKNHFGRGYGPVLRYNTEWKNTTSKYFAKISTYRSS
jgi:hypothetical protein